MTTPEQLRRQAEAVARVRAVRVQKEKAIDVHTRKLRQAIVAAAKVDAAVPDIALAADLTGSRIAEERESGE